MSTARPMPLNGYTGQIGKTGVPDGTIEQRFMPLSFTTPRSSASRSPAVPNLFSTGRRTWTSRYKRKKTLTILMTCGRLLALSTVPMRSLHPFLRPSPCSAFCRPKGRKCADAKDIRRRKTCLVSALSKAEMCSFTLSLPKKIVDFL